jgi:hypothetical protein
VKRIAPSRPAALRLIAVAWLLAGGCLNPLPEEFPSDRDGVDELNNTPGSAGNGAAESPPPAADYDPSTPTVPDGAPSSDAECPADAGPADAGLTASCKPADAGPPQDPEDTQTSE